MSEHNPLFLAWQDPDRRMIWPVGRLSRHPETMVWEFCYVQGALEAQSRAAFAPVPEFRDFEGAYRAEALFPFFSNRLMSPQRPDFKEHLGRLGLDSTAGPLVVLARSSGRRVTDLFEMFGPPVQDVHGGALSYHFFLRGIRHLVNAEKSIEQIEPGVELRWMPDPTNITDNDAILVLSDHHTKIGYLPLVLLEDLHRLRDAACPFQIVVVQKNPAPAPIQQRLLCRVIAVPPPGFQPFATNRYRPLSPDATPIDVHPLELIA